MTFLATMLILLSALLHASWNILGKSNKAAGDVFFFMSTAAAAILLTPFIVWFLSGFELELIPAKFWWLLLFSGFSQIVYLIGLALAYKQADIGVVYPVARALPVLMVGLGAAMMGQVIDAEHWLGFLLVTIGCLIVPITAVRQLRFSHYLTPGVLWAFIAAVGTTGYSILDKEALSILSEVLIDVRSDKASAVFYLGVQFWAIALPIALYFIGTKRLSAFTQAWQIKNPATMAGVFMTASYGLVLYAMTMTQNVAFIVALRQVSIVIGLFMGVLILKEKWLYTRGVGVLLIVSGLILSLT